jgi:putative ABC transport system permease protein
MMRTLDQKLLRELSQSKAQSLAIGLVIASGVAVFVMSLGTLGFLESTRDAYYDRYRFAEIFASLKRAPNPVEQQIADIEGVAVVQTRIVSDVTLDVRGLAEPAVGRLVSLPDEGEPILNAIHLRRGRFPEVDRPQETVVSEAFVTANRLRIGDSVEAVMNGRLQSLTIVGVALSPEYVFQIRGGDILPDDRRFGVFWMRRRQLEAAFDMEGAFNDVSLRLLRGTNPESVIETLDRLLKPYGAVGAIARKDQISAKFLSDEIKSLRATALVAPVIFLGVAAFLLNVVMSRRISGQREIIATLKAFGYSNSEVAWHYLKSALLVAVAGAVVGSAGGMQLGSGLAKLYSEFYRFPTFVYHPDFRVVVLAIGISAVAAVAGAYRAVFKAARMAPAAAMRPETPRSFKRTILERIGLTLLFPLTLRMTLRSLQRRPVNAAFSALGIGSAVSVLLLSNFASDSLDYLIEFQFETAQRQDVQVTFYQVTSPAARFDLRNLPGVEEVEPFRSVAVRLRYGHYQYRSGILGLGERRDLYQLVDTRGAAIRLPPTGIVLGDKLAELLHVKRGDQLTVEVLEGAKPVVQVEVTGIAVEYAGTNAYMRRSELNKLMRETDALSGAFLSVDESQAAELYRQLKQTPRVASVVVKAATVQQFRDTIAENTLMMQSFTVFFAAIIAVGVVYNTARISLDERSRELATLRVIGFTRAEVSAILLSELAIVTLAAIPIGWVVGYGFCYSMVQGFESELFRIPMVIHASSYAQSGLTVAAAAAISGLLVRRRLDHLDLVAVLKSRE